VFDPEEHAENRGAIETILRKIPGFSGYLNLEARRASDQLLRESLADRLQRSKGRLEQYSRQLVEAAKIDQMPQIDIVRGRIDTLIARLRGAPAGYSGFFDLVQVDEELLEDVYEHDLGLTEQVDELVEAVESVEAASQAPADVVAALREKVESLGRKLDQREQLLNGLEPGL
jgi:hypothetical protein